MQTLVVYAVSSPAAMPDVALRDRRVESRYSSLWPSGWVRHSVDRPAGGLRVWDDPSSSCAWPSWAEEGDLLAASLHVPLGYQGVIGDEAIDVAPVLLARRLNIDPGAVVHLGPPFVLVSVNTATGAFRLFTDAIGTARLFRVQAPGLTVWSNRPECACLFAGVPAVLDPLGWRYQAGVDWSMGDTSPLQGVTTVRPGTRVSFGPDIGRPLETRLDPSVVFASDGSVDLDDVVEALRSVATSVSRLWPTPLSVNLTGGRDSRLVAAAFLSAGVDVTLHTHDAVPGEAEAAEHLVGLVRGAPPHHVHRSSSVVRGTSAPPPRVFERVRAWHWYAEGLRPSSYLAHGPPRSLRALSTASIGGAGGEVAHGHFYPPNVAELETLPLTERLVRYRAFLVRRLVLPVGANDQTRQEVAAQVDRVLREGVAIGLTGGTLLDYFYADERLRRWSSLAEQLGTVTPLLTPPFVRAAFAITPQQRLTAALHRELIGRLVPAWVAVPFFAGKRTAGSTRELFRIGGGDDVGDIAPIFDQPSRWAGDFDTSLVQGTWRASLSGRTTPADELLLWRVVWRDVFVDHLAAVNDTAAAPRTALVSPHRARREPTVAALVRGGARSTLGRTVRRTGAGRAIETRLGPQIRRWTKG